MATTLSLAWDSDMDSKKRIKYHWRLFLPMAGMTWLVIAVLFYYQYRHETEYRADIVHNQLSNVNNRILRAYEQDVDLMQYITFLGQTYENSLYDEMMVSVYSNDGRLLYCMGNAIPYDFDKEDFSVDNSREGYGGRHSFMHDGEESMFYLQSTKSNDGQIMVITGMPLTSTINRAIAVDPTVWIIIVALFVVSTGVAYLSTRFLTRNVLLLRQFAQRAAHGEKFDDDIDFPHDELGDISRVIVKLYRDRFEAMEKSRREHEVALHAMDEKGRIKRQLTNNINHELKTPVGVIRGYIDTILGDPEMPESMRTHFLERAQANVERLVSLMKDVSTITRLDESGESITVEDVNLHDTLYSIHSDFGPSQLAPGMTFHYDVPLNCHVMANEALLNGMILNLIRNSGLHSHGTEIGFDLVSENDKFYTFSYWDNGNGVPDEHLPHLFERFYRVDEGRSRKAGGTGLGLPIVRSTIISLGGTIAVHNRAEGGLEFVFTLPKWSDDALREHSVSL